MESTLLTQIEALSWLTSEFRAALEGESQAIAAAA
jgi:hypothetical protein